MLRIHVDNPYHEVTYKTDDLTMNIWKNFLENYERGNEDVIAFEDKLSGDYVTINPKNFASVQVAEEDEK